MINKISNYIVKGKGIGALLILAVSVLWSASITLQVRSMSLTVIPDIQLIANEILPLKMENGVITTPKDIKKVYPVYSDDKHGDYHFTIDTSVDTLNTADLKSGIYLTRSNIYNVDNKYGEIRSMKLKGDIYLEKKDYIPYLQSKAKLAVMILAAVMTAFLFIYYFILNLFYTFITYITLKISGKKLNFDAKMRLSSICLSLVWLLSFIDGYVGIYINWFIFMVLVVILQIIIAKKLP